MKIKELIRAFKPDPDFITLGEKIKSGLAAAVGVFLLGEALKFLPQLHYPTVMLASMAASAVLLYAVPHSPMAQPWPLIGGHFVSALCGWFVAAVMSDQIAAASVAVGIAIFVMSLLRCLHPPGAATALIMVLNYGSFSEFGGQWAGYVLLLNALISLLAALLLNNLLPGRRYPMKQSAAGINAAPPASHTISRHDIEHALAHMDGIIDVSEDDLLTIYEVASKHARDSNRRTAQAGAG